MTIDLHTHSSVSDGTDAPAVLVRAAAAAGLTVVALADHDTTAGWGQALAAAEGSGVEVVPAVEVSTRWRGSDVHLLALWPDGDDPAWQAMLAEIRRSRDERLPRLLRRLADHGVHLTEAQVRAAAARSPSVGRPHVADAMVAAGYVADRAEAFDRWLGEGRPGHVPKHAPDLVVAIRAVQAAGGVAVLAHPWGRGSRTVLDASALGHLADAGLAGVEVDHVDHDPATRDALRAVADRLGLVCTGGSDYHGAGKAGVALGAETTERAAYAALQQACRRGRRS
jgi:predicted metal-dependent phosphoesterase TrpH